MIDYVFELVRRHPEVQRNYSGANLGHSIIQLEVAMAVERKDGYTVAFPKPDSGQAGRQAINALADCAKCEPDGSAYHGLLIGSDRYRSPQAIQNGPGHNFSSSPLAKEGRFPPPL